MGEENQDLSIAEAYQTALSDDGSAGKDDGSEGESKPGDDATKDKEDGKSDEDQEADDKESDDEESDDDESEDDKEDDSKDKSADKADKPGDKKPDASGEYTKERFDGLMSTFNSKVDKMQKDHQLALQALQDKITGLSATKDPEKKSDDLPEDLRDADPETQAGFKIIMSALESKLSTRDKALLDKVKEAMNEPANKKLEQDNKIVAEIDGLATKHGNKFTDNKKAIVQYAVDNNYAMGTLELAMVAWQKDQEIASLNAKIKGGKKVNDEVDKEDKKKAEIPAGGADRGKILPKFDEKRDGKKSFSELMREGLDE